MTLADFLTVTPPQRQKTLSAEEQAVIEQQLKILLIKMVDMGIPINKYSFNILDFKLLFNVSQDGYLVTKLEIYTVHNAWMQADTQLIGAEHFDDDGLKSIAYKHKAKYAHHVNTPYNENSWVENTNPLIEGVQYRPSKYNPNKLDIVNKQDFKGQRRNLEIAKKNGEHIPLWKRARYPKPQ